MTAPLVSVLLTSYNRPGWLRNAVGSVLAQTMRDWELIILDDCSTDPGVPQVLAETWDDPQVIIYKSAVTATTRRDLCRYAVLANTGLAMARGRLITYLCDDDWYAPRRLELMTARIDADDQPGVVYGSQGITAPDGTLLSMRAAVQPLPTGAFQVDHSSVMHTAEAGRAAGGWDENPAHWTHADAVFWDRLAAAGYQFWPVLSAGEPLDYHRTHAATVTAAGGPY
jgi:spore maturation protein CgeD